MHDIEPYYKWRELYIASEDDQSPFFGRTYNEFQYTDKIYNYFIHPQWDYIGSPTLYIKILFVDYLESYALIELIGEWNDAVNNDIMFLKRKVIDHMIKAGINKYVLLCDNVLNFHGDEDCYYEEWYDDIKEENGWITLINVRDHIYDEMNAMNLQFYLRLDDEEVDFEWQRHLPETLFNYLKEFA